MTTAADLERIVDGPGTKADRARSLMRLGCDRTDVVELLGMSYSQAHSIWKELISGKAPRQAKEATRQVQGRRTGGRANGKASGEETDFRTTAQGSRFGRALILSPSQTRVLTQDGHAVVKVDTTNAGTICRTCDLPLAFSLVWLGFVHKGSKSDPTDIQEYYEE